MQKSFEKGVMGVKGKEAEGYLGRRLSFSWELMTEKRFALKIKGALGTD